VAVRLFVERALLPGGIARRVAMQIAGDGTLERIDAQASADGQAVVPGLAVPGMPNLHSHAFQRALAGRTEFAGAGADSFWGWREAMYHLVGELEPADVEAIAAFAYLEMLEAGYTSVAEFHYLHHERSGEPYPNPATVALALRAAARQAGIRQLLLPCLYQTSDFGAQPPTVTQRRFVQDTAGFQRLVEMLNTASDALRTTGVALHSLRAVPLPALREVVAALPAGSPVHIHVAEQRREVADCLAFSGRSPIAYLLETGLVDERWCLVHATHADAAELRGIAQAGAVVGLCPTTESNLGDGRFALDDFLAAGGRFGIGSDSQVSIDPREELRTAEYTLRIWRERRALAASSASPHCGTRLYSAAATGGAQALGLPGGQFVTGAAADLVVLDTDRAAYAGVPDEALLDAYVFAPRGPDVRDVMVAGRWVLRERRHPAADAITRNYEDCVARLARAASRTAVRS
jgi:formimidoylglutamate deiminase